MQILWLLQKKAANSYFQIPLTNTSRTNITIKENEFIGKLQLVSSIVPMPFKQLKSTDSEDLCKLKDIEPTFPTNTNRDLVQKNVDNRAKELTNTEDQQIKETHRKLSLR